jgi:cyclic-di-GMP-binding protein
MNVTRPLPGTLDYRNAQQCMTLLNELPLTNVPRVRDTLTRMLYGLRQTPPRSTEYLEVLEAMRAPLHFLQESLAIRYSSRPVIPGGTEDGVLRQVVALWLGMAEAYAQTAENAGVHPLDDPALALVCQRCVLYAGRAVIEYFRARRTTPRGMWLALHGYFSTAEEWGLATQAVPDNLKEGGYPHSAAESYCCVLLIDLSNPYGRSPREFEWVCRWADQYASLTEIMPVFGGTDAKTYAVDLNRDAGAKPLEVFARSPHLRRLGSARLASEIERVVAGLKQGLSPEHLGLGADCHPVSAGRLLLMLYKPWCHAANPRRFQRRRGEGELDVAVGFEAMHFFVAGAEFVQPPPARIYSHSDFVDIATFGERAHDGDGLAVRQASARAHFPTRRWTTLDHSVMGYRLRAPDDTGPIEHSQLLAVFGPDAEHWRLARVSWLMVEHDSHLLTGLHVLPGTPRAIALRALAAEGAQTDRFVRAFLLPAVQVMGEEATLVLPRGWFQPNRQVEIFAAETLRSLTLTRLTTFGVNYERVTFSEAAGPD